MHAKASLRYLGILMGKWFVWIAAGLVLLISFIGAAGLKAADGVEPTMSLIEDIDYGLSHSMTTLTKDIKETAPK